jgi:diacylglycerol kinase family enzyme
LQTWVIVNRAAHLLVRESPLLAAIRRSGAGAELRETRTLGELSLVAEEALRAGAERVVLAGGDGSYMAGVTAFARLGGAMPGFALAPGGTVSTVARNWGFGGERVRYAERLVETVVRGEARPVRRPTLAVAGETRHIGFIFGAGLVPRFFEEYYAAGALGYGGAARIVARVFAGSLWGQKLARRVLSPVPALLSVDGAACAPAAWSLVVASVVRDLGLHMILTPRAGEDHARFHAVASPLGVRELGPQLPRVLAGRRLAGAANVDRLASHLRLRFATDNGVYVLDGEMLRAREVAVTAGPEIDVYQL